MRVLVTVFALLSIVSTAHSWGDDPVPSKNYTRQDIAALATEGLAVIREDRSGFFIDKGNIFYFTGSDAPVYVKDTDKMTSLLLYQGKLVARRGGEIYIMMDHVSPERGNWHHIGSSVSKMATDGTKLYYLTKTEKFLRGVEREIWVYKGSSGAHYSLIPTNTVVGGFVPYSTGSTPNFEKIDIRNPTDLISSEGGPVVALIEGGGRILLSRERSNPPREGQAQEANAPVSAQ